MNKGIGRLLILAGLGGLVLLFAWEVFAADASEMQVIETRRNIPLSDADPVYHDYYINAGSEAGLKPNLIVTAVRKISIKDSSGAHSFGELPIPVGQLKIIFVQNRIAVAREYKLLGRDDLPMLEQIGIMASDGIDLKGSFIDNRKTSVKTSSREETTPVPPAATEPVTQASASSAPSTDRVSNETK